MNEDTTQTRKAALLEELFSLCSLSEVQWELQRRAEEVEEVQDPNPAHTEEEEEEAHRSDDVASRRSRKGSREGIQVHKGNVEVVSSYTYNSIGNRVKEIVELFRSISAESNPEKAMVRIVEEIASFLHADRVSIYVVDSNTGGLTLQAWSGRPVDSIASHMMDTSITGHVAHTGVSMVVNDVDECELIDPSQDIKLQGYKTRSMLVVPIKDGTGTTTAVLQVVNKLPEGMVFTDMDHNLVSSIAQIGGMALENCDTFKHKFMTSLKQQVGVFENIAGEKDPDRAVSKMIEETAGFLSADRVSVYVVDDDGDLRLKVTNGKAVDLILGTVTSITNTALSTGNVMLVNDVKQCKFFDVSHDQNSGYTTRNMLVAPIKDASGTPIAVLQVVNKLPEGSTFTELDENLVSTVAAVGGMTLKNCTSVQQQMMSSLTEMVGVFRSISVETYPVVWTKIVKETANILKADRVCIYVWEQDESLTLKATTGSAVAKILPGPSICANVARTGEVMVVNDVSECPLFDASQEACGYTIHNLLVAPVLGASGAAIAVLQVVNKLPRGTTFTKFTENDKNLVSSVASIAGMALGTCLMQMEMEIALANAI